MDEQLIFSTNTTCTVGSLHSPNQTNLKQCSNEFRNGSCLVGSKYLLVAQARKALINVYRIEGSGKRESVEQRLPLPETVNCLEVVENNAEQNGNSQLPYLLLASTSSGKLYIWEMASGNLLTVKAMAHYQAITKIRSIIQGKYVITSGADARIMIWQTVDLVSQQDPKPLFTLHDHTLAVTDFEVSNAHSSQLSGKLFTVSHDMTMRCYDLNMDVFDKPQLLTTFTFPFPLECITLDPADRACYVGGAQGVYALPFYYPIGDRKVANLLSSDSSNILSCVEQQPGDKNADLFTMGKVALAKITNAQTSQLACSLEGSLLVVGDSLGKCTVMDVYSKQPVKEIQAIVANETAGEVTSIILNPVNVDNSNSLLGDGKTQSGFKIPNLQKNVFAREGLHDILFQIEDLQDSKVAPLDDFEAYLDQVAAEEGTFAQLGNVVSTVKVMSESEGANRNPENPDTAQRPADDGELLTMKATVGQLTGAYKELREMYDKLFQEHESLRSTLGEN
ncbi:Pre-rRNA-processing protein IPI3 [Lachancea thermotolerans]